MLDAARARVVTVATEWWCRVVGTAADNGWQDYGGYTPDAWAFGHIATRADFCLYQNDSFDLYGECAPEDPCYTDFMPEKFETTIHYFGPGHNIPVDEGAYRILAAAALGNHNNLVADMSVTPEVATQRWQAAPKPD